MIRGSSAPRHLTVITGAPRPPGWSGKLWAAHQGVAASSADLLLLTDADIVHNPAHISTVVAKAERDTLDLVSEMVELRASSLAERALVPAFVFFFQLLYPFARVNDPANRTAAAAGGTMLVRRSALERIGGIAGLRGALIDDVTLAARIKPGGPIYLGHSLLARSLRPYPGAADIWRMVARTAYVQLRFSPALLAATVLGLALVWLVPPAITVIGHGPARAWRPPPGPGRRCPTSRPSAASANPRSGRWPCPGSPASTSPPPSAPRSTTIAAAASSGRAAPTGARTHELGRDLVRQGPRRREFPVGSALIRPALRPHIHAFYAFARNADDIADSPVLAPATRWPASTTWKRCCSGARRRAPRAPPGCAPASPKPGSRPPIRRSS